MQGNQAIQLSSLERALSAAIYFHQFADGCCGMFNYLRECSLEIRGPINYVFYCRVCKKKIAMLIE